MFQANEPIPTINNESPKGGGLSGESRAGSPGNEAGKMRGMLGSVHADLRGRHGRPGGGRETTC